MRVPYLALSIVLAATTAQASSPDAWADLDRNVAETCAKASGLKHAHVSQLVMFDDSLGKVVTLVTGLFPQKALKGQQGRMLCVFDKATKKAWIDEAKG